MPSTRTTAGEPRSTSPSVLAKIGMTHVEVSETGGHPVVYADWLARHGAPTVLLYGHYDVQPVEPLDLWKTAPFEPVVRDGRKVARGAWTTRNSHCPSRRSRRT